MKDEIKTDAEKVAKAVKAEAVKADNLFKAKVEEALIKIANLEGHIKSAAVSDVHSFIHSAQSHIDSVKSHLRALL